MPKAAIEFVKHSAGQSSIGGLWRDTVTSHSPFVDFPLLHFPQLDLNKPRRAAGRVEWSLCSGQIP